MKFTPPGKQDLVASLVVFIVALPLSLGIALASGANPAAGLITAIIGGIVAGFLAGAPLSVTGPAAGMTALVFQLVQQYGLAGIAIIAVFAGLLQIALGALRAGKLFNLIPNAVLEGVLTAIGAIIVLGQIHVLAGGAVPKSVYASLVEMPQRLSGLSVVLMCGLLALAIQLLWTAKMKKFKWIPGALPAVVAVTALSTFWDMPRVSLEPLLPLLQSSATTFFTFTWVSESMVYLLPALGVAVVASAESLITARAVDTMASTHEKTKHWFKPANLDQELSAQGVANVLSGIFGGLPMTAVMVRSAANVESGARTRWSTILHGTWIAVFVGLLPGVISLVPLTALAAVLILVGYKLLNVKKLVHEWKHDRVEGFLWTATAVLILATDLLSGLVASLVLAAAMNAKKIYAHFTRNKVPALIVESVSVPTEKEAS